MIVLYLFTFLAGIATVLSPCVLPVLPAILSAGAGKGRYRPLGVVIGLVLSFAFFTLSLTYLVHLLGLSANVLRYIAIAIIGLFGMVMLFPNLSDRFARATSSLTEAGSQIQTHQSLRGKGFSTGLLLGASLGLVWTPCAGPILAAVTTLVATQKVTFEIILLTFAYALGSGLPLLLIAYGGQKALTAIPFFASHSESIKKLFGFLMILTAVALYYNLETTLQQLAIKYVPNIQVENNPWVEKELSKLRPASPFIQPKRSLLNNEIQELPMIGRAPEIVGITQWINSNPLTLEQLRGKTVLIDFWTYSCINCIRTFPYLKDWYQKYKDKGLVIIGVHTPEFEFEKDPNNVKMATEKFEILYPVAMDNGYKTWQAYSNNYWPAHYLIDKNGVVRDVHFGEGNYLETENAIRYLLGMSPMEGKERVKRSRQLTPETYLGYHRANSYSPDIKIHPDEKWDYHYQSLGKDKVGLKGEWLISKEKITSESQSSELVLNFVATRVYLVMEASSMKEIEVLLDGQPLSKEYYTSDMNESGQIVVQEARKYDVLNLKDDYGRHEVTLKIPKGVSAYAFTFGDE